MPIGLDTLIARNQNRSTVTGQEGMVCTSQPLATQIGIDILKAGGNAIDAALAANAMLSLVEPFSCGPGGDLFAIVWSEKDQKLFGLNASGRSPYDWSLDEAGKLGLQHIDPYSPLAWSVPGCVSGWQTLADRFGTLSLAQLLEAPIHYARQGFAVTPIIAHDWSGIEGATSTGLAKTFAPNGRAPRCGETFKNPDLADFLDIIGRDGAQAFYQGEVADRIVRYSEGHGGRFSRRDFQEHTDAWVEPVSSSYRGYDVWQLPPNGQGIAVLQMLNLLEHFDIAALEPNSAKHLHLLIESKKLAFEDRAVYYADLDFADVPVQQLISKDYAQQRVKLIDDQRAAPTVAPGRLSGSADTVYLTAADCHGNMVSLIQSIYHGWGSGYVPDGLGFVLQNRGQLFSLNRAHRNQLEPHKRPFQTIIPGFVTQNDQPLFAFGVMGGDFQPQGHAQILMNLIDFSMSAQQAGQQPRIAHHESSTPTGLKMIGAGTVTFEQHIPLDVRQDLADMGHNLAPTTSVFGGYQGIWRLENPRRYLGGSDPRKDGNALGY